MREAPLTDGQKVEKGLYGSYAPPMRGRGVTAQSENRSRTRRKGGIAMNSKIAFGSAMLALVAVVLGVAGPADARWVNIKGTHTAGEIQGKCSVAGGTFSCPSNNCNNGFRCDNTKNGGGKVTCGKDGKCTGSVPARTQPQSTVGIGDVLGGAPLMEKGEPPKKVPQKVPPAVAGGGVSTAAAPVCQCACEYYGDRRMIETGVLTFTPQPNNTSCTFLVIDNYFLCKDSTGKDRPGTRFTDCKLRP